jgi:NAD(P)-dependent dehydrogenase (short-subunit alcohol dehydrogenase family)
MDLQLAGRRALVTGGSRGIGKAVAAALVAEGATVTITARGSDALERTAAKLGARAVVADTGDDNSVRALVAQASETMGGIDILVNAAATPGGQSRPPTLAEITPAAFWADLNVKVFGYLRCAQAVAPGMVDQGWGRIISVSGLAARSTGSTIGSIRNVAVAAMTKNLADELGPSGVNVTVVHPGTTRTEATPGTFAALATAQGVDAADIEQRFAGATTIGRMVNADEVAHVIAFLASPLSVAINGDAIACGGGQPGDIHY